MEKLNIPNYSAPSSTFGLESLARQTSAKDIPDDCLELIWEKLALVDHYRGWGCLMMPSSLRESPFNRLWFLKDLKVSCTSWDCPEVCTDDMRSFGEVKDVDHIRSSDDMGCIKPLAGGVSLDFSVKPHSCWLSLADPGLGKEQNLHLDLEDSTKIPDFHSQENWYGHSPWVAADKGLLVQNLHEDVRSKEGNRHDKFIVVNPVNNSMKILPPLPFSLCSCKLSRCNCKAVALKLSVNTTKQDLKSPPSSSYKAYIMERKRMPRSFRPNSRDGLSNFRVTAYDSVTNLWARTGAEWIGNSSYAQIFPMRKGVLYVSIGSYQGPQDSYHSHDILYKFQNGRFAGKVKPPCKLKQKDRHCYDHDNNDHLYRSYSCRCISNTVFEAEGKIFYFQQISWVGSFGPNCVSATVWELDDRQMSWCKVRVLHPHKFEVSKQPVMDNMMFLYEGILLVPYANSGSGANCLIAGFNVFTKTWCKVPEILLENSGNSSRLLGYGRNAVDLDGFVFQPNVSTRA